jgi:hypothetical protein
MRSNQQDRRPHVDIPSGPPPIQPRPNIYSPYSFEVTRAGNPWNGDTSPKTAHPSFPIDGRLSRTASAFENAPRLVAFPVPDLSRSVSAGPNLDPSSIRHRSSKSDIGSSFTRFHGDLSSVSLASSYYPEDTAEVCLFSAW